LHAKSVAFATGFGCRLGDGFWRWKGGIGLGLARKGWKWVFGGWGGMLIGLQCGDSGF